MSDSEYVDVLRRNEWFAGGKSVFFGKAIVDEVPEAPVPRAQLGVLGVLRLRDHVDCMGV